MFEFCTGISSGECKKVNMRSVDEVVSGVRSNRGQIRPRTANHGDPIYC